MVFPLVARGLMYCIHTNVPTLVERKRNKIKMKAYYQCAALLSHFHLDNRVTRWY